MIWLFIGFILLFGLVVLRGAPYLPTMRRDAEVALDLLDLKPGQTLLELGSGDGVVAKAAAERGLRVVGYELNPLLALISKFRCRKLENVHIIWGDYWQKSWPPSDGMYVFLLDRFMSKLDHRIEQHRAHRPYRLVSHTFKIPGKTITTTEKAMHLYVYTKI